jgi:hypothetical protein
MSLPPYDEALSVEFGKLADKAYLDAWQLPNGGQCIFSIRAAYDYYTGRLPWPASRDRHISELREALGLKPLVPTLPELVVNGQFLGQDVPGTGTIPWTAIQCSDFGLLAEWQNGVDITPVLAQRRDCGFNLLRVWTAFDSIPGIGTFTSIVYETVPQFVSLCAAYGLYVEFTAYTGVNNAYHWAQLVDAAEKCSPKPLLELVNELDQNTNEPDSQGRVFRLSDYYRPTTVLCSHGSNGSQARPVEPFWDYATFHTNDAPEWWRKVGHNAMEIWDGPTLSNENTRYPDKATSWVYAEDAAAGAALLCAGSCFHSVNGKASQLWTGDEETAARMWAFGANSVPLKYQAGRYNRPDLPEGDDLRTYQRVLATGDAWTVHIRK